MDDQRVISSDEKFYTISDIAEMTGWYEKTVQKLFLDPQFPSADYGRIKVVESHALIDFFSSRHDRAKRKALERVNVPILFLFGENEHPILFLF